MAKRKIARLECPKARNVCFTKRRQGLFKKAAELSRLYNVQIAAVAFSPAGTPFEFGNTSLVFDRYIATVSDSSSSSSSSASGSASNWAGINALFDVDISKLNLSELTDYASNLNKLKSRLLMCLEEKQRDDSEKEDEPVVNNGSHSDGVEFTLEELMSDIIENDDDLNVQSELAKKNEEWEAMVRELMADDTNLDHNDGEFDDYFAGLSKDEFINELLSSC